VCDSVGLNPLTRPFEYLTLQGKTVLYARKDCTDQLRSLRRVSLSIAARERVDDVYIVTARATSIDGRVDESIGAVTIGNLKGDALCNAIMKAETKAKRRVTLSICGLGLLDESEIETVPQATPFVEMQTSGLLSGKPDHPEENENALDPREEIRAIQKRVGWSNAALFTAISNRFDVGDAMTLSGAIAALGDDEVSQVIDLLSLAEEKKKGKAA
jgi:hypothetical protein